MIRLAGTPGATAEMLEPHRIEDVICISVAQVNDFSLVHRQENVQQGLVNAEDSCASGGNEAENLWFVPIAPFPEVAPTTSSAMCVSCRLVIGGISPVRFTRLRKTESSCHRFRNSMPTTCPTEIIGVPSWLARNAVNPELFTLIDGVRFENLIRMEAVGNRVPTPFPREAGFRSRAR